MKKLIIVLFVMAVFCVFNPGLRAAGKAKQAAAPVVTSAMMFAEELQKSGVKGKESADGVLPSIFRLIGLREYREITGHDFSVQIWDFKSASGFNIADFIYNVYSMLTDMEAYKSRPYIVCVNYNNEEARKKIVDSLKKIVPGIKEAGTKEF